jgi:hypothetical protein
VKGSGQADALIRKYREVIATDYAQLPDRISASDGAQDFGLNTEQKAGHAGCAASRGLHTPLWKNRPTTARWPASTRSPELEQLDRQRASMPQHVIDMLGQRIALTAR